MSVVEPLSSAAYTNQPNLATAYQVNSFKSESLHMSTTPSH